VRSGYIVEGLEADHPRPQALTVFTEAQQFPVMLREPYAPMGVARSFRVPTIGFCLLQ
jgi:hypothetical protein